MITLKLNNKVLLLLQEQSMICRQPGTFTYTTRAVMIMHDTRGHE